MKSLGRITSHEKGTVGEDRAVAFLLDAGYQIICRNYRSRKGEIDCIVRDPDGMLVFVEVKNAIGTTCGNPAFWVTSAKQRTLFMMARRYLAEHNLNNVPCRFDIIAISQGKVDHLKNAIISM